MRIEARLIEYGRSLLEPGCDFYPATTVMHKIREMQENAGARPEGFTYDMVGPTDDDPCTVACMPDGGLADMVDRMSGAIDRSRRCAEMREAINTLPADYKALVQATYCNYSWRDIPRRPAAAAKILGWTEEEFAERRRLMWTWLEDRLVLVRKAA